MNGDHFLGMILTSRQNKSNILNSTLPAPQKYSTKSSLIAKLSTKVTSENKQNVVKVLPTSEKEVNSRCNFQLVLVFQFSKLSNFASKGLLHQKLRQKIDILFGER